MSALATTDINGDVIIKNITYLNGPFREDAQWDVDVIAASNLIVITVSTDASVTPVAWRITGTVTVHYVEGGPEEF
jgi:hypothetical protein